MQVDKWGLKNAYFCYIVNVWVIIDPHWNLETCNTPYTQEGDVVIIEPHWNLEEYAGYNIFNGELVIIESHWNLESAKPLLYSYLYV